MKKTLSIVLVMCLLLSMLLLSGCSNSDTAELKEALSSQYEWETIFTSNIDNETLTISRRHDKGFLGIHCTYFKITVYESGNCTYFYSSVGTPCKNGLKKCNGELATLKDACTLDSKIEAIYPYVEEVVSYQILEKMLDGSISTAELTSVLFYDMVTEWIETQQEDIISEFSASAIGIVVNYNDYVSKAYEIGFSFAEAAEVQENTKDQGSAFSFIAPWLDEMKEDFNLILLFFGIKHATANKELEAIAGNNSSEESYQVTTIKEETIKKINDSKKALHDNFKILMDEEA